MGMDLTSDSGAELRFSGIGWNFYLRLAESYGWSGTGTLPPEGIASQSWTGTYDSNEGQRVARDDAARLADALETALVDPERLRREAGVAAEMSRLLSSHFGRAVPIDPPGDNGALLREFVQFCRTGGFRIE